MALLTLAEVRALVETDLTDPALTVLVDDADAAIVDRYGDHTTVTATYPGGHETLQLPRPADPAGFVAVETTGTTDTILAADDFRLDHGGRTAVRLNTGTNKRSQWATVTVTYTPRGTARRKRVLVDLVKLALQYRGLKSETSGDWRGDLPDYQTERERLLTEVDDGSVLV